VPTPTYRCSRSSILFFFHTEPEVAAGAQGNMNDTSCALDEDEDEEGGEGGGGTESREDGRTSIAV